MMQTFVRPSRDLRNHYAEISDMLKNHDHVRERRAVFAAAEFQPPAHEPCLDVRPLIDIRVEPSRVRPRWQQHDDGVVIHVVLVAGLLHPLADLPAVWWVAPHRARPGLFQSILLSRIVTVAFVVLCVRGGIQRKAELRVKHVKKVLWGLPQISLAGKQNVFIHPYTPASCIACRRKLSCCRRSSIVRA